MSVTEGVVVNSSGVVEAAGCPVGVYVCAGAVYVLPNSRFSSPSGLAVFFLFVWSAPESPPACRYSIGTLYAMLSTPFEYRKSTLSDASSLSSFAYAASDSRISFIGTIKVMISSPA